MATQAVRANGIQVQASSYGMGLTIVYGRARIPGTLIWYGDFQAVEHDQQVGKGGGGGQNVSYTYSSSFQLALCEGPITAVSQIWQDSSLVSLSDINGTVGLGAATQAAWSHLGSPVNLQYPYTAWVGCVNLLLGSSPNVPNFNFQIDGFLQFNPSGSIYDADPSAIVNDLLTSTTHGIGFGYLGSLTTFHDYCLANSIFLSTVVDQETTMSDVLTRLLQITNSFAVWTAGQLSIIPYGDEPATGNGATYTPPTTVQASLSDANYVKSVEVERKPLADLYNVIRLEWIDPTNNYNTTVAEAKDQADIDASAIRQSETIQAHDITNATLAQQTAQRILQRALYIRNTYTFTTTLQFLTLQLGDVIEISDSNVGLVNEPVRITKIAEQDNDELEFTCEEFPAGVSEGAQQSVEPPVGFTPNFNGAPDTTQPIVIFRAPQFLVNGAVEIWIGACGSGPNWGGANVLVSQDNVTYTKIGTINPGCRYGTLVTALADSASDPDLVNSFEVALEGPGSLSGGTHAEADNLATLTIVDRELIAYASTTLISGSTYSLGNGYMRRQCYQTAHAAHAIGDPWMRVDDNIFRWQVDPSLVGTTVYIKIQPWNLYGGGLVSEASLTATTYVVGTAYEIPDTPPVPSNFVVIAGSDGLHISWENTNPAAVGITSVEFSPDNATWTVLGQVQGTHYVHAYLGNKTYYYRARSRSPQFIWSAYTASVSAAALTHNLLNTASWKIGTTGSQGNFIDHANLTYVLPSEIDLAGSANTPLGPYGQSEPLWVAFGAHTSVADGGWVNTGDLYNIDPTKTYRASVWVYIGGSSSFNGSIYLGCDPTYTNNLAGTQNTNPYFISGSKATLGLSSGRWYLLVGMLHGSGYGTASSGMSGVYDPTTGLQIYVGVDFKCIAGALYQTHRTFGYSDTGGTDLTSDDWIAFVRPRFEICDGSEPSIPALLAQTTLGPAYLDSANRVSPVAGALNPNGSVNTNVPDFGISYTSTTTSITLSWPSFTLYLMDGTSQTVPANSGYAVTGLTASTTYTFYPYIDPSTWTVQFAAAAGGTGSPAVAYATNNGPAAALANKYTYVPLNSITASTPASGSGGGGGNKYGCLHPDSPIQLADGRICLAGDLRPGDLLPSPDGPIAIWRITGALRHEWWRVQCGALPPLLVTADHRFLQPDMTEVRAQDLKLGMILAGDGENHEVVGLGLYHHPARKVGIELREPHLYFAGGLLSHNPKP